MEVKAHEFKGINVAEIISDTMVIAQPEDGLELLGNMYYQGFDKIIIHAKNITPDFFDLKTGMAGEILQKFSNYRVKLAIVGDFSIYGSKSIQDFIFESNKLGHVNFAISSNEALERLAK